MAGWHSLGRLPVDRHNVASQASFTSPVNKSSTCGLLLFEFPERLRFSASLRLSAIAKCTEPTSNMQISVFFKHCHLLQGFFGDFLWGLLFFSFSSSQCLTRRPPAELLTAFVPSATNKADSNVFLPPANLILYYHPLQ